MPEITSVIDPERTGESSDLMRLLTNYSEILIKLFSPQILAVATLLFLFFLVSVLPHMADRLVAVTGTKLSPDTAFVYSVTELYAMAEAYGQEGRAYYIRQRFTFDLIWPAVYFLFFSTLTTFISRKFSLGSVWRRINILPAGAVCFDLLENITVSLLFYRYPLPLTSVALIAPVSTMFKWLIIGLIVVAVFSATLILIRSKNSWQYKSNC